MKLLPTFASRDKQQEEITRKILRTQEVNDMAQKANAKLARAEEDFNSTLAVNRSKWALEEEEHSQRIQGMTQEIEALENRKQQALIPIQLYKQEVDVVMADAQGFLTKAKEKDEQNEYLQEKLEEKLSEVSDRESLVAKEESRQQTAQLGIQTQQQQVRESSERLLQDMTLFHVKQKQEEESLEKRKKEVALAEISFSAKLDKYARDMEALKIWDAQLKDERDTLARAFKRLS